MSSRVDWRGPLRALERIVRDRVRYRDRPRLLAEDASHPTDRGVDYAGCPRMRFAERGPGGYASGEVVWTWVAYEEDRRQGKDRPVLLIGSARGWLLGLPATSKDHDRDAAQEARAGRYWFDIGRGDWDSRGRESEVRVDRIVRIEPGKVRRAAGQVSAKVFDRVAAEVRRRRGQ